MISRQDRLGHSAVPVTALSFGAAGIGNLFTPITDTQAEHAVAAAWDAGVRYFDTAPHYGLGLSERRLGAALRGRPRSAFTVSTKVGRLLEPVAAGGDDHPNGFAVPATHRRVWDFSAEGVRRSLHDSLERLGIDRVDIAYLHDPDDHAEQALREAYPELERLRDEGVLGAIGVGMNRTGLLARFIRDTDIDAVLLAGRYTLLDQSGHAEVLSLAAERRVGVVIGGVFNSGLLADPRPGATFDYATAPDGLMTRSLDLKAVCERYGVPLRAAALRFPYGHPAVASVLLGARSAAEVRDAATLLQRPVPDELWAELRERGLLAPAVPTPVREH
ncbi:aldo/keto reductase [Actinoplanes sp. DH11]|uniref:aldo/keto reductase n=1 Tax=Actinoplanes sp. DH11 TaxID=2857011 RepID=UPI001E3E6AA6|nr:aldo/keto reductase [Actinoplanes sp. DH11]